MARPTRAAAGSAASSPSRKLPVAWVTVAATKAPIMYTEPWARLMSPMMPNTSVRPAAIRNSMTPSCSPFRTCSRNSSMGYILQSFA